MPPRRGRRAQVRPVAARPVRRARADVRFRRRRRRRRRRRGRRGGGGRGGGGRGGDARRAIPSAAARHGSFTPRALSFAARPIVRSTRPCAEQIRSALLPRLLRLPRPSRLRPSSALSAHGGAHAPTPRPRPAPDRSTAPRARPSTTRASPSSRRRTCASRRSSPRCTCPGTPRRPPRGRARRAAGGTTRASRARSRRLYLLTLLLHSLLHVLPVRLHAPPLQVGPCCFPGVLPCAAHAASSRCVYPSLPVPLAARRTSRCSSRASLGTRRTGGSPSSPAPPTRPSRSSAPSAGWSASSSRYTPRRLCWGGARPLDLTGTSDPPAALRPPPIAATPTSLPHSVLLCVRLVRSSVYLLASRAGAGLGRLDGVEARPRRRRHGEAVGAQPLAGDGQGLRPHDPVLVPGEGLRLLRELPRGGVMKSGRQSSFSWRILTGDCFRRRII